MATQGMSYGQMGANDWFGADYGTSNTTTSASTAGYAFAQYFSATASTTATATWTSIVVEIERKQLSKKERKVAAKAEQTRRDIELAKEQARKAAYARAELLLTEYLNDEQQTGWRTGKQFIVQGPSGRRYRLSETGVSEINEAGRCIKQFCNHVLAECPWPDMVLTRKLAIENNEAYFLANAH
jgi:hypothetical protein